MKPGVLALLLSLSLLGGCSTISNVSGKGFLWGPAAFGGTRENVNILENFSGCKGIYKIFACPDLPFSLALDLVLLPFTLPYEIIMGGPFDLYEMEK